MKRSPEQTVALCQVIMATNRADTLDPALLRPGRLDRKIEFPNPDRRQKRMVFTACVGKMNLSDEVIFSAASLYIDILAYTPSLPVRAY